MPELPTQAFTSEWPTTSLRDRRVSSFVAHLLPIVACLATLTSCDERGGREMPRDQGRRSPVVKIVPSDDPSSSPAALVAPVPPAVPRMSTTNVEIHRFAQVYLNTSALVAHRAACSSRTNRMLRAPLAVARKQGYTLHSACASMKDPPEYRTETTTHPAWIEYERKLSAYERDVAAIRAQAEVQPAQRESPPQSSEPPPSFVSTTGSESSSSREVHVRGYYRKDGTYVSPHSRSRPRR